MSHYHPVTCVPFTAEDLQYHRFQKLREQYATPEAARVAREQAVKELVVLLESREKKEKQIEREIAKKEDERAFERSVAEKAKAKTKT